MASAESVSNPQSLSNAEWMKRRSAAVARGIRHSTEIFTERAANAEIWDVEGRRYVDFAGGIAVVNTSHRGPKVLAAVQAFDIVKERGSEEPDATRKVVRRAADLGLILLPCGVNASTIRILVPLTASDALIDEGLDLLEQAPKA